MELNRHIDLLYKNSAHKISALLTNQFGHHNNSLIEDSVNEAFIKAIQGWGQTQIPENPQAWVFKVAKRRILNHLKRDSIFKNKISPLLSPVHQGKDPFSLEEEGMGEDNTVNTIFACCHPLLPKESQIAMALRVICNLGIEEISGLFFTTTSNVNKRLYRYKEKFRDDSFKIDLSNNVIAIDRLDSVLRTLYLMFNVGYYSGHSKHLIRTGICYDAIWILKKITKEFPEDSKSRALLALMLLLISRFESRVDDVGSLIVLERQNRSTWDRELMLMGLNYLNESTQKRNICSYQLQSGIAAEHCLAPSFEKTNWESIISQYTILEKLQSKGNLLVRFNKLIAQFYSGWQKKSLKDICLLGKDHEMFSRTFTYNSTLAVLYAETSQIDNASSYAQKAIAFSNSKAEKELIKCRMNL